MTRMGKTTIDYVHSDLIGPITTQRIADFIVVHCCPDTLRKQMVDDGRAYYFAC